LKIIFAKLHNPMNQDSKTTDDDNVKKYISNSFHAHCDMFS
jgi:hypothetical protein